MSVSPLPPAFFDRPVLAVAPDLLGGLIERETADGLVRLRLTEVEAYDGANDPGSHAFRGQTPRNATMFGPPGRLYVYFTYGMHWCLNLVCGPPGDAAAVLLRAGEVLTGVDLARHRRSGAADRDLARGPARLAKALAVDRALDGADVTDPSGPLRVLPGRPAPPGSVLTGPRTGVAGAGASFPWRFALSEEATVSPYRPAVRRRREETDAHART